MCGVSGDPISEVGRGGAANEIFFSEQTFRRNGVRNVHSIPACPCEHIVPWLHCDFTLCLNFSAKLSAVMPRLSLRIWGFRHKRQAKLPVIEIVLAPNDPRVGMEFSVKSGLFGESSSAFWKKIESWNLCGGHGPFTRSIKSFLDNQNSSKRDTHLFPSVWRFC